ncbi:hypothetical protein SAY86_019698 [Trapa natans]|uniref:Cyclin N-terminal domain-containing protein n=1 Tax=Trapa natans TaxID=22666 RepID=A0AAN7LNL1_TRANT|nr:hypothetical protein SAY86_019698 [Trapa natans]
MATKRKATSISSHCISAVDDDGLEYDTAVSPSVSDELWSSPDETVSTSYSFSSPLMGRMDDDDGSLSPLNSTDRKILGRICISEHVEKTLLFAGTNTDEEKVHIDCNYRDPRLCADVACDIYKHLRASEMNKRPTPHFMERIQLDINESMRAKLIDWLVEVAEEYELVTDTLYLTVNYIDRYLSGNMVRKKHLQLVGVASMMIASRFVRASLAANEVPSIELECLANYISELSLLDYSMLCYAPSIIAASSVFLAKYILVPTKKPWDSTLQHYTLYRPWDLRECVKDLHRLCLNSSSSSSSLPAIREKYSQDKHMRVAQKHCPPSIPAEFFNN